MSATQKSKKKLLRIVLASTVGSLLWAGCAQPRLSVMDRDAIAHAPVDLTKRRPDTNPHLRSGIWQVTWQNPSVNVVTSPNISSPHVPPGTVDSTHMLAYNPEVINAVPPELQGSIIIEAAGAEPQAPRRTWRERWFKRSTPPASPVAPQQIERYEEREIIIERQPEPKAELYKPSREELDEDEGGKLIDTFFVNKK